jgi:hypothetical protein
MTLLGRAAVRGHGMGQNAMPYPDYPTDKQGENPWKGRASQKLQVQWLHAQPNGIAESSARTNDLIWVLEHRQVARVA